MIPLEPLGFIRIMNQGTEHVINQTFSICFCLVFFFFLIDHVINPEFSGLHLQHFATFIEHWSILLAHDQVNGHLSALMFHVILWKD